MGSVGDVLAQCVQEMGQLIFSSVVKVCAQSKPYLPTYICVSGVYPHCIPLVWCAGIQNVHSSKLFDVSLEYDV